MTLEDIMKPNKYGTMPMLHVMGVCLYRLDGNFLKSSHHIIGGMLPLDTAVNVTGTSSRDNNIFDVENPILSRYIIELVYWIPLTADQILLSKTLCPGGVDVRVELQHEILYVPLDKIDMGLLLDDGSGWLDTDRGIEPASFYIEDILYRLDLQDKVT